ncbi:MAG: hypothetical protein QM817_29890 [Archangium sp.]
MNQLAIAKHLALYTTFHQDHRNQLVHQLASPFVYFSAILFVQVLAPMLVLPLLAGGVVLLTIADWKGALAAAAAFVVEWACAVWLSHQLGTLPLLMIAAVVQGSAWATLIFLGHTVYEPHVSVEGAPASKGLYFERKYNLGQGLGAEMNLFDRALQFSIAPLAHANELLFAVGLRRDFETEIVTERAKIVARLDAGLTPFDAERASVVAEALTSA